MKEQFVDTMEGAPAPHQAQQHGSYPLDKRMSGLLLAVVVIALLAAFLFFGVFPRLRASHELASSALAAARLPVAVIQPKLGKPQNQISLPANVQAFVDTPIYARTNGYLKRWLVDIGAKVQEGQLLAEIDTPEVDQQLRQAEAAQAQVQANLDLARITANRYLGLLKSDGVSQQEVDQNVGALKASEANLNASAANVRQLRDLQSFKEVRAPFAGTITARFVDTGALISNGTTTTLFRLAKTDVLRVYASVPQAYSRSISAGVPAQLHVPEFPGRSFSGKVVRTSGAIDASSRTLLTEIQIPNPKGELLPGSYGTLQFNFASAQPALILPANTLLFRAQGTQVAVVDANQTVHLKDVAVGQDLGTSYEVLSGLDPSANVIVNPSDSIAEGTPVTVTVSQAPGARAPK
jgi:RND family efflux transporter MFP subunit